MKNPKKPTYQQKRRIEKAGLDPMRYLVERDLQDKLILVDREPSHTEKITIEA